MSYYYGSWAPYVSVAERRKQAEREIGRLRKKGQAIAPVIIEGRVITATFWGKAWCANLESYHDFASRLPRGRSYVRNRAVLDLQISPREVRALVSGSSIYKVKVSVASPPEARWLEICRDCAGGIDSLVELLQGRLSKGVMERLCRQETGLFPKPSEIKFSCSCPDFADMCKHVAAVLYGVGARLDEDPELLFRLRAVDEKDLLRNLDVATALTTAKPAESKVLAADDISALFGIEMAEDTPAAPPRDEARTRPRPADPKTSRSREPVANKAPSRKRAQPSPVRDPSIVRDSKASATKVVSPAKPSGKRRKVSRLVRVSSPAPAPAKPRSTKSGRKDIPSGKR